jgi:polar amino acid transport system permease protein
MEAWSRFLDTFFNWDVIERYFPAIMKGVVVTIEIAAAVVVTGTLLGLALAIVRTFRLLAVNALIVVFVDMFRALPPLVLVLLVYFGLPNIGINLPSFAVLWLVLALVLAAFARRFFGPASCRSRRVSGRRRVPRAWAFSARSPISCCHRRSA